MLSLGNDSVRYGVECSAGELVGIAEPVAEATVIPYFQPAQHRRRAESRRKRNEEAEHST